MKNPYNQIYWPAFLAPLWMGFLFLFIFLCSSCAHQTVHEYCIESQAQYLDYNQCYQEESSRRIRKREAWAAAVYGMGQSMNQGLQQSRPVQCITNQYGTTSLTNCR